MVSEPLFDEVRLKASLLAPKDETGGENTVGGRLIGSIRNSISGRAKTAAESAERQQSNDMLAEVAADTIAMLPGVTWAKAGAVRAVTLFNPNEGLEKNGGEMALNFAEGVVLHKLGKYGAKIMHTPPGAKVTLLGESTQLAKFGFGMGAVKAAFQGETWKGKDGNLDLGNGLVNVAKAGTVGGVIGVPAGLVGNRIARYGMAELSHTALHPRALSVGLGMASGYPAGAVFGGVDAAMRGGNSGQILKAANESGLVGMFAGGFGGALMPHEAALRAASDTKNRAGAPAKPEHVLQTRAAEAGPKAPQPEHVLQTRTAEASTAAAQAEHGLQTGRPRDVEVTPHAIKTDKAVYPFAEMQLPEVQPDTIGRMAKLGAPRKGAIEIRTAVEEARKIADGTENFSDFAESAIVSRTEPARIYSFNGIEIVVPEAYAVQLDRVQQLHLERIENCKPGTSKEQHARNVVLAGLMQKEPAFGRAHPTDLIPYLEQLPDRSLIKRIELLDTVNPEDAWHQKNYREDFEAAATAGHDGTVRFFKARYGRDMLHNTHHEAAHLLKWANPRESEAFDWAAQIEKNSHENRHEDGYSVSKYSKRNNDENWAEHAAELTAPDPTGMIIMGEQAPIRTTLLARTMAKALAFAPAEQKTPYAQQLSRRLLYINEEVQPRALELLEGYLKQGTTGEQFAAAKILREIGNEKSFEALVSVAKTSKTHVVQEAAFEAAREMAFYGRESWSSYTQSTYIPNPSNFMEFLIRTSSPDSRSRHMALPYLDSLDHPRAQGYYALYTAEGSTVAMRKIWEAMHTIPEVAGKHEAYSLAQKLLRKDPNAQFLFNLSVLEQVPPLRKEALASLVTLDLQRAEPALRVIVGDKRNSLYADAEVALQRLAAERQVNAIAPKLKNSNAGGREEGIRALAATKEMSALRLLIKHFGSAEYFPDRPLVQKVINENFNRQLVKAEAHELIRSDSRWRPMLQALIDNRSPFTSYGTR